MLRKAALQGSAHGPDARPPDDRQALDTVRGRAIGVAVLRRQRTPSLRANQREPTTVSASRAVPYRVHPGRITGRVQPGRDQRTLPDNQTPTKADGHRVSRHWTQRIDRQVSYLQRLNPKLLHRLRLLEPANLRLSNADDEQGLAGPGPDWLATDENGGVPSELMPPASSGTTGRSRRSTCVMGATLRRPLPARPRHAGQAYLYGRCRARLSPRFTVHCRARPSLQNALRPPYTSCRSRMALWAALCSGVGFVGGVDEVGVAGGDVADVHVAGDDFDGERGSHEEAGEY